ncbi:MAG: hypothetical protein ACI85I_001284 [Arenicella sp.]
MRQKNFVKCEMGKEGTCINGFAHESELNGWRKKLIETEKNFAEKLFCSKKELIQEITNGMVGELPKMFQEFICGEPVKSIGTTFCVWQTNSDSQWRTGKVELPKDGSADLLQLLDGKSLTYKEWAENYYEEEFMEKELKFKLVEKVFNGTFISREIAIEINSELEDFEQLKPELNEIGYEHQL